MTALGVVLIRKQGENLSASFCVKGEVAFVLQPPSNKHLTTERCFSNLGVRVEAVVERENMIRAMVAVERNKGAAGVDDDGPVA